MPHMIGLMSGTSVDGVDAALVHIEGSGRSIRVRVLAHTCVPYSDAERCAILRLCDASTSAVPDLCVAGEMLAHRFADASEAVARLAGVPLGEVLAIASHGQTVWHQPALREFGGAVYRGTLQIGSAAELAARTGCAVVSDFRSADMAAGGQGAPLVPYADWALLTSVSEARAVQNIGGIANVTYLPRDASVDRVVAFDTGPGNMVIDALVRLQSGGARSCDEGGQTAARGKVDDALLNELLEHPFFRQAPPRTTGREEFGAAYAADLWSDAARRGIAYADLVATATALTAESIARAYREHLGQVDTVVVGGGGAHNRTLMAMLAERLAPARLTTHEEYGIPGDAKEAIAFAILGYEAMMERPSNVPSATGARRPVILGSVTRV